MIENDYRKCEKIIKNASKSFYSAFSQIKNKDKRQGIYAVYAFCRYADDVTDEADSLTDLLKLESDLTSFKKRQKADNFIFRTLKDVWNKFYPENYSFEPYFDMIQGQKMDFDFKEFKNLEDLYIYCEKVASSVGNMLNPILAPNGDNKILLNVSYNLGIAMQITNILRDIGEDFERGRIYIPTNILSEFGVTKTDIKNKVVNNNFINLFNYLKDIALKHYNKAIQNLYIYPKDSRTPLYAATIIYREILFECERNGYDIYRSRQVVSKQKKLQLLLEVKKYA